MRKYYGLVVLMLSIIVGCNTSSNSDSVLSEKEFSLLWETEGLVHPESIVLSPEKDFLFVSNIGEENGDDGFISKVSLDGEIIELKWVDSLQAPKGIEIIGDELYVSAVDELIQINISTGKITNRHTCEGVTFLNDVTSDDKGNVYISGMFESAIYQLDTSGEFTEWYQNDELEHPNGVLVQGTKLYIGTWGRVDDSKVEEDSIGHFYEIDLATKELNKLTKTKPGKIDGIQSFGDDLLLSLWKSGKIISFSNYGEIVELLDTETSVGDFLYVENTKTLFLPLNFQNKLEAYRLK